MVLVDTPGSVLTHPAITVAAVTVIFEKLLLLLLIILPDTETAVELVNSVTVPPAFFVNVPAMLLLFTFWVPVPDTITLSVMKVILPAVFTLRLVKVLPLIACESVAAEFEIYVLAPVPATEYVIF